MGWGATKENVKYPTNEDGTETKIMQNFSKSIFYEQGTVEKRANFVTRFKPKPQPKSKYVVNEGDLWYIQIPTYETLNKKIGISKKKYDVVMKTHNKLGVYKISSTPLNNVTASTFKNEYGDKRGYYVGELSPDTKKAHGFGLLWHATMGVLYEGYWAHGLENGQGRKIYSSGAYYEGFWKDGQLNGYGTCHYHHGWQYEGNWKNGKLNGQGTYHWSNGDYYEGQWNEGCRNGQGVFHYQNRDFYDGEWKNDKNNGHGIFNFANGDYFKGVWNNNINAQGTMYYTNGTIKEGNLKSNVFKSNDKSDSYSYSDSD